MRFAGITLALAGIFAGNALGQTPNVTELANIYSWTLAGLPNYGTARGSIFAIFGTSLSSTTVPLQGGPLQTTLSGVSLTVTVNGVSVQPLLYFLSPGQINAVLPSETPVGTGTITVTNGTETSAPFPIQVVESAFGLLTFNYGSGQVAGFDASNGGAYLGFSASANPGDILELWGTGLGPVADDATGGPVSDPAVVFIGGIAATLQYHGRSGYTGLDQINVQVPTGVSGCNVSVVVQTGSYVSNFATIPVTATGRTCSDPSNPLSASILSQAAQTGSLSIGIVGLNKATTPGTTVAGQTFGGGTVEDGFASFFKINYSQLTGGASPSGGGATSLGSCVVAFYNATTASTAPPTVTFTYLNAGPDVNINGPDGALAMPLTSEAGIDIYTTPATDTTFIPDTGGNFTFNNGTGGPDVGAFSTTQLNMTSPLTWSNMGSISTVTRANGVTVNWTGGDPSTYVSITGTSFGSIGGSDINLVVGDFTCQAPVAPGTFTVPAPVLLSLPPSFTVDGVSVSNLSVSNVTGPVTFSAPGLDVGLVEGNVLNTITVTYQ
jgi:uncharacterized protein (TIGR03437 family)